VSIKKRRKDLASDNSWVFRKEICRSMLQSTEIRIDVTNKGESQLKVVFLVVEGTGDTSNGQ
jgi:hypothetical protein